MHGDLKNNPGRAGVSLSPMFPISKVTIQQCSVHCAVMLSKPLPNLKLVPVLHPVVEAVMYLMKLEQEGNGQETVAC